MKKKFSHYPHPQAGIIAHHRLTQTRNSHTLPAQKETQSFIRLVPGLFFQRRRPAVIIEYVGK